MSEPEDYFELEWEVNGFRMTDRFHANQLKTTMTQARHLQALGYMPQVTRVVRGTVRLDVPIR